MMGAKTVPWLLVIIIALVISIAVLSSRKIPPPEVKIKTEVDTVMVHNVQRTIINKEKVITEYDTVYIDGMGAGVARYHAKIDTTKVSVDLDIAYWELYRKFDVKATIDADVDTVYITKTITTENTIVKPPKFVEFTSGMSTGFKMNDGSPELSDAALDLGLRFRGRYDVGIFGRTSEIYGVRLGIAY